MYAYSNVIHVDFGDKMRRKATRQSPGTPAEAKRLMAWIKDRQICAGCNRPGPVINHHFLGSTRKVYVGLARVAVGEYAVNGLCQECDDIVTHGTREEFRERYGLESECWMLQVESYPGEIPLTVFQGIAQCGK